MLVVSLGVIFARLGLALCWYGLRDLPIALRLARHPNNLRLTKH